MVSFNDKSVVSILLPCLQFEVFDWDSDGSHDQIGGFTVSLQDLQTSVGKEVSTV